MGGRQWTMAALEGGLQVSMAGIKYVYMRHKTYCTALRNVKRTEQSTAMLIKAQQVRVNDEAVHLGN